VRSGIDHGARGGKDNDDWPAGGQGRLAVFDTTMRGEKNPSACLSAGLMLHLSVTTPAER
jgi:hypothetical protein